MATETALTDQTSNGHGENEKVTDDIKTIEKEIVSESKEIEQKQEKTVKEPTSSEAALTVHVEEVEDKKTEPTVVEPEKEDATKEPEPVVEEPTSVEVIPTKPEEEVEVKETVVPAVDDKDPSFDIPICNVSNGSEELNKDSEAPAVSEPIIEAVQKGLVEQAESKEVPDTGDKEIEKLTEAPEMPSAQELQPELVEKSREVQQSEIETEKTTEESETGDKAEEQTPICEAIEKVDEKTELPEVSEDNEKVVEEIKDTTTEGGPTISENIEQSVATPICEAIEKVDEKTELVGEDNEKVVEDINDTTTEGGSTIPENIEQSLAEANVNVGVEENKEEKIGDEKIEGLVKGVAEDAGMPYTSSAMDVIKSIDTSSVSEVTEDVTKPQENLIINEPTPVDVKESVVEETKDACKTDEVVVTAKDTDVKDVAGEPQESELEAKVEETTERDLGGEVEKVVEGSTADEPAKDGSDVKSEDKELKQDVVPSKQRQSKNLISKVKHSIVKAKKAILGKSPSSKTVSSEATEK